METKGGKGNAVQYSQQEDEKGEQLECVHQSVEQAGGQPRLQGGRVGCTTRWGSRPALAPALGGTGRREAGDFSGEWFHLGCCRRGRQSQVSPCPRWYCTFSAHLTERSSHTGDRLVLGAELQVINCIKKKKQCLLAELCNGLHINLREILCGITAASQEFGCRSQEEDGSPANRRSRRWSGSCLPRPGGQPNHSYSSIVMRNGNCIQHQFLSWSLMLWV